MVLFCFILLLLLLLLFFGMFFFKVEDHGFVVVVVLFCLFFVFVFLGGGGVSFFLEGVGMANFLAQAKHAPAQYDYEGLPSMNEACACVKLPITDLHARASPSMIGQAVCACDD